MITIGFMLCVVSFMAGAAAFLAGITMHEVPAWIDPAIKWSWRGLNAGIAIGLIGIVLDLFI